MPIDLDERYSRQVLFPPIGLKGQQKLAASTIAVIGCGATGSAVASLLARAGVGHIRIVDRDYVEPSNLQRQSLFDEADARQSLPKALAAASKIAAFNSDVEVQPEIADLTQENIEPLLGPAELLLDATDNFETRYLINEFAVRERKPWIYTAAVGSYCLTMNIVPGKTACLACVFPDPPRGIVETCDTAGILNSAVNLAASLEASEAIKLLLGAKDKLRRTLLSWDVWTNERAEIRADRPAEHCSVCQKREFVHLEGKGRPHITLCGRNSVQIHERNRPIDFAVLGSKLAPHGTVKHNEFVLKFWREPYELTVFPDGRAIVKGTTDISVARTLYARFIGS